MMKRAIITAASKSYSNQLLVLLGSLKANWPSHPPVIVYDLGLPDEIINSLSEKNIQIRKIPEFCPHWRNHFTWKIWCWNDVDAESFLWIDAGVVVLHPLDELFPHVEKTGYMVFPNYRLLEEEASEEACHGCGLDPSFRKGKTTLAGNFIGFSKKNDQILSILRSALELAMVESNIKATNSKHRHDQALISLLIYKNIPSPLILDGNIYLGGPSPNIVPGQKLWACRRFMKPEDIADFSDYFLRDGIPKPALPETPFWTYKWLLGDVYYQINRVYKISEEFVGNYLITKNLSKIGKIFLDVMLKILSKFNKNRRFIAESPESTKIYNGIRD